MHLTVHCTGAAGHHAAAHHASRAYAAFLLPSIWVTYSVVHSCCIHTGLAACSAERPLTSVGAWNRLGSSLYHPRAVEARVAAERPQTQASHSTDAALEYRGSHPAVDANTPSIGRWCFKGCACVRVDVFDGYLSRR